MKLLFFIGRLITERMDQTLEDIGAYILLDNIARHLARHPYLALGVSAGILSFALPFIIFMVFAIATVILTFTGFVIVEGFVSLNDLYVYFLIDVTNFLFLLGTLITMASVLLFGFLGVVLLVSLFFGIVVLAGYFGFIHVYDMLRPPVVKPVIQNNITPKTNKHDKPMNGNCPISNGSG